ncbi:MAG: hypothetical protein CTY15_05185 [Methylocystis sp.]|nr:MAG: hypothetical protein CTY15_05185 [Methylocystis sp.]
MSADADAHATGDALRRCVERLKALVEAETRAAADPGEIDFEAFNQRKSHALVELTQMLRMAPLDSRVAARGAIAHFRTALAENADALGLRLRAMQEISALLIEKILEDESDGTYSKNGTARR